jgi:hypothetical protein
MNSLNIECKRIARDLAESIWCCRSHSLIGGTLQGLRLVACNADDQVLVNSLDALALFKAGEKNCYVHWISYTATNYILPPENASILYVMRPARVPSILQHMTSRELNCGLALEKSAEVALIYVY